MFSYAGCPRIVRSDYGTENCFLAATQIALRMNHTDSFSGIKSYRYGKSTTSTVRLKYIPLLVTINMLLWPYSALKGFGQC